MEKKKRRRKLTAADVWAMFAETDRKLAQKMEEYRKEQAARELEYSQKEAKYQEEYRLRQEEINKQIGGMSKSDGEFAESLFFHTLEKSKTFAGVHFDMVSNGFKMLKKMPDGTRLEDQFDIVMVNDDAVAIIEVKYRARSGDPKELIERKMPNFRKLFSDYANYKIYLGLGSFAFDDRIAKDAEELGIGLLKVAGDMVEFKTDWVRPY